MAQKHILIIDDELDIAESLATVLEAEGYTTEVASSGTLAFQALEKKVPDLIILDVMMPKIKGPDVVRVIREEKNISAPVILISASHEPQPINEKQWSLFMRKPFDLDEMLEKIEELLW